MNSTFSVLLESSYIGAAEFAKRIKIMTFFLCDLRVSARIIKF